MGGAAAAGRRRGADGELRSAGATSGLAASAVRTGPTAGLRWCEAARRSAALHSPGTGSRYGRRTAARAARHGGCSGESKVTVEISKGIRNEILFSSSNYCDFNDFYTTHHFQVNCFQVGSRDYQGPFGKIGNMPLQLHYNSSNIISITQTRNLLIITMNLALHISNKEHFTINQNKHIYSRCSLQMFACQNITTHWQLCLGGQMLQRNQTKINPE